MEEVPEKAKTQKRNKIEKKPKYRFVFLDCKNWKKNGGRLKNREVGVHRRKLERVRELGNLRRRENRHMN